MKKNSIITFIAILLCFPLGAEHFRVSHCSELVIGSNTGSKSARIGYNDALVIFCNEHTQFLRGIEIEVIQPSVARNFPHSIAYNLYRGEKNQLKKLRRDISAQELYSTILSEKKIITVQIPTRNAHGMKKSPYVAYRARPQNPNTHAFVVRFSPIMKGLPDTFFSMKYTIKVTPLLSNEGGVAIKLTHPTNKTEPVEMQLDGKNIAVQTKTHIVPIGSHHLTLSSDAYRSEVRNFTVSQAQITSIDIELKSKIPTLLVSVPQGFQIFLDGKTFTPKTDPTNIRSGHHRLLFKIGSYKLERSFSAKEGKSYHINLNLDVDINEED